MKRYGFYRKWLPITALGVALMTAGCGGGGGGGGETETAATGTAYYLDAAVAGVSYRCGTSNGTTDERGAFRFQYGEECRLSVGPVPIRTVAADELYDGKKVVESDFLVAAMLQAMDEDGNLSNGIRLSEEALRRLSESNITARPETADDLDELLQSVGAQTPLMSSVIRHLEDTIETVLKERLAGRTLYYAVAGAETAAPLTGRVSFDENLTQMTYSLSDEFNNSVEGTAPVNLNGTDLYVYSEEVPSFPALADMGSYLQACEDGRYRERFYVARLYEDEEARDRFVERIAKGEYREVSWQDVAGKRFVGEYVRPEEGLINEAKYRIDFRKDGTVEYLSYVPYATTEYDLVERGLIQKGYWSVIDGKILIFGIKEFGTCVLSFYDEHTAFLRTYDGLKQIPVREVETLEDSTLYPVGERARISAGEFAGKSLRLDYPEGSVTAELRRDGSLRLTTSLSETTEATGGWSVVDDRLVVTGQWFDSSINEEVGSAFALIEFEEGLGRALVLNQSGRGEANVSVSSLEDNTSALPALEPQPVEKVSGRLLTLADEENTAVAFYPLGRYFQMWGNSPYPKTEEGSWVGLGEFLLMLGKDEISMVAIAEGGTELLYFGNEGAAKLPIRSLQPVPEGWPELAK